MFPSVEMKPPFSCRWISDLSLSRKLSLLVWLYLFIIVILIGLNSASTQSLSAVRAYVNAEGAWSRAQKEAVLHLLLYARPGDQAGHYTIFRRKLAVHKGDMKAWAALQKQPPDIAVVTEGFVKGGVSPEDVQDMVWLFTWFGKISYAQKAIGIWNEGAAHMTALEAVGEELHRERSKHSPDPGMVNSLVSRIESLDTRLTALEDGFSAVFGEMARRLDGFFSFLLLIVKTVFLIVAMLLSYVISKRIRLGVKLLSNGAARIGKGDFSEPIAVSSRDELGGLAMDFNTMSHKLAGALQELQDKQEMLRESEKKYRFLVENIPHSIFYKDRNSVYVTCNRALAQDLGISGSDCAGKTDYDFFPSDLAEKYRRDDQVVMKSGAAVEFDRPYACNGETRFIHTVKAPIKDEKGSIVGILGIFWDITERKRIEESLKERLLFEDAIFTISSRFNLSTDLDASINISLEEMGGLCNADWVCLSLLADKGKTLKNTHEWRSEYALREKRDSCITPLDHLPWLLERLKRGEVVHIADVSLLPPEAAQEKKIFDAQGSRSLLLCPVAVGARLLGLIGLKKLQEPHQWRVEDLTLLRITSEIIGNSLERQQIEANLREYALALERSNRELEQFAYVASHDLQEPLRKIMSFTELLQKRRGGQGDEKADRYISFIVDGAKRMSNLIHDLLVYSRIGRDAKADSLVDCNTVLAGVLEDLDLVIRESGAVVTFDRLPAVVIDEMQLGQLFQNLISNAIKFHDHKPPRVHVSALSMQQFLAGGGGYPETIAGGLRETGDGWVFSVKDNGIGISPQCFDQIFLIFQRLHARTDYSGTGIGLAICKKVVENLGGVIWVESEKGKGATFFFTIPKRE